MNTEKRLAICSVIKQLILRGKLLTGQRIDASSLGDVGYTESEIAAALPLLEGQGLVTESDGMLIAKIARGDVVIAVQQRRAIESFVAFALAQVRNEHEIEGFSIVEKARRAFELADDRASIVISDIEFHLALAKLTICLPSARPDLVNHFCRMRLGEQAEDTRENPAPFEGVGFLWPFPDQTDLLKEHARQHQEICDAIEKGDHKEAAEAARWHITATIENCTRVYAKACLPRLS